LKIYHLPPRFLDTQSLLNEQWVLDNLFWKIANADDSGIIPEPWDRLWSIYKDYHAYIFARLEMVYGELEKRGLGGEFNENKYLDALIDSKIDFEIFIQDISRDFEIITSIWEEFADSSDDMLPDLIEQLSLSSFEDIINELNSELERIKDEYDINT
jgi:hypothetical protein